MASRRASTNSLPAVQNLGNPYQIFTEVVSTGKNVSGSKTKVKWLYGWSNSTSEHCVEFKVSLLTGHKRIFSDGQEIYSGGSVLETEFDHSWPQDGHMLRIECALGVTSDSVFNFLIDSVTYKSFPLKSGLPRDCVAMGAGPVATGASTVKGFGSSGSTGTGSTASAGGHRRGSSGSSGSGSGSTGVSAGSRAVPKKAASDPFGTDAFGSDPFGAPAASKDPFSGSGSDSFDPFASTPSSASKTVRPPARPTPPPAPVAPAAFDPFGSAPASSSSADTSDPFGAAPVQKPAAFDPFGSAPAQPAAAPATAAAPVMDLFSAPIPPPVAQTAAADPFAPQVEKTTVDFSNISFTPPKAPQEPATAPPAAAQPVQKDAYGGLVNLDLGGSGGSHQRRTSLGLADHNNPPLNSMVGGGGGGRPVSMQIPKGDNNPFAQNAGNANMMAPNNGSNNPFTNGGANMNAQQPPGGANRRQSMAIRGNDVTTMYNPQVQQQSGHQQKSSLDSLDWKI